MGRHAEPAGVEVADALALRGSWVGSAEFATFVSFYPNLLARTGMGSINVALSTIDHAMWLATEGRSSGG